MTDPTHDGKGGARRAECLEGNSVKDQIARSLFWFIWSRGAIQILSFLSTILVARMLNPADYGLMALTTFWIYTLSMFA